MVLQELEIQGFKSFPDRTKIKIGPGITAVVGPNGSGKSNISDAIRWVLGETSSKQLRGAGKMEDVIFGGTQTRGAMGYAMVNLTMDNLDRRIDVDADQVTIGRRYYRSGESEYTINGQNVRLKDIYELFLDTGVGRDGYSIISQGRIAEIVGAKSNERREIFEEASGIARYRYRKNEAERRLAGAEDNLVRLRDILAELESRVGPLEKESQKAQQFLELSARRKEREITLWVDNIRRSRETVREQQRRFETAQADYDRLTAELESIDAETEEIRRRVQQYTVEIERRNADIRAITEEMAGSDSRIAVLNNDIAHNETTIASLRGEIEQGQAGKEAIAAQIAEKQAACEEAAARCAQLDEAIARLEERLCQIQEGSQATGERRGQLTAQLAELTDRQTGLRVQAASAAGAGEQARERQTAAAAELETARAQREALRTEQADTEAYLAQVCETVTRLENIKGGLQLKLDSRRRQLEQADAAEQSLQRQAEAAQQRLQVLRDLERNMDGFQQSVKTVMRAARERRLRGIIGPVGTVLTVEPGYEMAIETALGFAMQNIVVEGETSAKAAIAFLRDTKSGRATFLPLDTVQGSRFSGPLPAGARVAADLVQADARYAAVVDNLLGRIIVVEDINEASRVARELRYRNRVVTVDGQVVNAGGSFTGGSVSRTAGVFSRKQEIDELKAKLEALDKKQEQARESTDKWKAEVDALTAELTATGSEAITAGGDKIRAEMECERLKNALAQADETLAGLEAENEQLAGRIESARAQARAAAEEDARLGEEIAHLEAQLADLAGSDDEFLATRARLSDELSEKRLARLGAEKDGDMHRAAIENLESRTGENAARARELARSIGALEQLNEKNRADVAAIQAEKAAANERINQVEQAIRAATEARMIQEGLTTRQSQQSRNVTDQREKMSQEMARLTERKAAAETDYDQTVAKLWEEYQLTPHDAEGQCVPFESAADLRREVQELRGKIRALGNVNVGAIEEYAEVSERFEFLRSQVRDVEKSKAELTRLIAELAGEMKEIFTANFKQININFARIFAELFGGGTARLTLSDEENVLESGIDIQVSPPGKVIKNLAALSGGEQSLVAICIYFAILAVNPSPFCILDEIEAALDDVNVARYAQYLRRISDRTQFIVITHRRGTMEAADVLYGVTMQEDGVSKLLRLDLDEVDATLVS
ncbi:chromosome segregation protein SMC [Gemmiger sp. An120]|uniref:chromosome segregation protein SMC n=1 Tax=Gemmiger sp. An120 TaxID=1965549 RepID=UPI000B396B47|nr:chromosome segregation protein SMC [Gemmiger sp. An120]OUQ42918.1 chromosome segregation protein SMC [Gemmiger sp. An120]